MVWTSSLWPMASVTFACMVKLLIIPNVILPAQATPVETQSQPQPATPAVSDSTQDVQAQLTASDNPLVKTQWNGFEPPSRGIPGRREAGGTRGGTCFAASASNPSRMTALIPESTLGRTASDKPMFFYYVPFKLNNTPVDFELTDENDKTLYNQSFVLSSDTPGIIQVDLSQQKNIPGLKADQNYRWYLTIKCDLDDPSGNIVVHGWVQRVELSSSQRTQLAQADPLQRLQLYAQKGLWYETLAMLAQLRSSNPNNSSLQSEWSQLLNAVGLARLANQPLVPSQVRPNPELEGLGSTSVLQ